MTKAYRPPGLDGVGFGVTTGVRCARSHRATRWRRRRWRRDVIGARHRAQYEGRNPLAHLTCQPNGRSGVRAAPVTHIAPYTATPRPAISQAGTPEQAPCCGHRCPTTGNRADRCGDSRPCAGRRCPDDTAKIGAAWPRWAGHGSGGTEQSVRSAITRRRSRASYGEARVVQYSCAGLPRGPTICSCRIV